MIQSFDVFFINSLRKLWNKQSSCRWSETPQLSCDIPTMRQLWTHARAFIQSNTWDPWSTAQNYWNNNLIIFLAQFLLAVMIYPEGRVYVSCYLFIKLFNFWIFYVILQNNGQLRIKLSFKTMMGYFRLQTHRTLLSPLCWGLVEVKGFYGTLSRAVAMRLIQWA